MYSLEAEARNIPGLSLFPKEIGLSIEPVETITSPALI